MARTKTPALGICRSAGCSASANGPVELYDGPGRFCPECGNYLQAYDGAPRRWSVEPAPSPAAAPEPQRQPPPAAAPPPAAVPPPAAAAAAPARTTRPFVGIGLAAAAVAAAFGIVAVARGTSIGGGAGIGVCTSTMSAQLTRDLIASYARQSGHAGGFDVRSGDCALRFAVATATESHTHSARSGIPIAYDALVAVVHPQNGMTTIDAAQLRDVLSGRITTWAPLNGRRDPITVVIPDDGSDEARLIAAAIMQGTPIARTVQRVGSTAEVVRTVAAPRGRNTIGIAAFSGAVPAKVLALKDAPIPSALSIGEQRYPLSVAVNAVLRDPRNGEVGGLVRYASSPDAHAIAQRDGLIAGSVK